LKSDYSPTKTTKRIQFSIASLSCVACTSAFKKGLDHLDGVKDVSQLPMFNKIVVEFDPKTIEEAKMKDEILHVAEKAGFKGKVIISK
jgi:copper chaperone CopZ